ncbi:hypothetical protein ACLOJK_041775 [Asimina triloba]
MRGFSRKVPQSNQALSISSDAELDECNQERGANVGSAAGSSSSQKFVSRSSSRLSRSLSRFNFIPDNLSFRLSRAASLGSSCSYSFFSTSLSSSNPEESNGSENRDEIHAHSGHHIDLPSTNLSLASHSHDSSSVRQQLDPPLSVHSQAENFCSSQDLAQSHVGRRPESSLNERFQQNHIDTENAETRRFDRRTGAHEPAEGSVRFSRTLSVGRLRDRVLRRTSFPEGFFRHLQGDRIVGDAVHGNGRQVLGAGTRAEFLDGNMETLPNSSGHNIPSTSNSMNGQQDYELEGLQMREASNHAFLERRTAFLERRRRIRSQVRALQRLGSRFENLSGHDRACILSGQHRTGHCTCRANSQPINPDEDTSARASISRIVMLAEALFEVLDEIHQQSVVLSSRPSVSSIGSVPAPKEVVESMPVKIYKKSHKHQNEEVAQVCPLCRGDVCRSELLASTKALLRVFALAFWKVKLKISRVVVQAFTYWFSRKPTSLATVFFIALLKPTSIDKPEPWVERLISLAISSRMSLELAGWLLRVEDDGFCLIIGDNSVSDLSKNLGMLEFWPIFRLCATGVPKHVRSHMVLGLASHSLCLTAEILRSQKRRARGQQQLRMASLLPNSPLSAPSPSPSNLPSKTQFNTLISIPPNPPFPHQIQHSSRHDNPTPPRKKPNIQSRLSQLCKDGRLDIALSTFDALPRPNTVLWNTIVIGFVCNGMPHEALRFYARMLSCPGGVNSDFYSYSSALKACAETRQLKLGKSIHCQVLRTQLKPSRILCNSLLNMYSACLSASFEVGAIEEANSKLPRVDLVQKLFNSTPKKNVVTWNTMIAWYAKTARPFEALRCFKMMAEMGIKPTVVSFVNVFPAVVAIEDHWNADILYGFLLKSSPENAKNLFAVSSAIFMYSELSAVDSARRVFDSAMERNTEVWNTMIDGYVQNDCPNEALSLFLQILDLGQIVPDDVTFLTALIAVSQMQQLEFGRQLHTYVVKELSPLPVILLNAIIVMYSRCNAVETAFIVFDRMLERDIVSWNTMVSAFVQNGFDFEGLLLVYGMQKQGFFIDSVTATALLSAASNLGDLRMGKQIHGYLFRHGIQFDGMDTYLIDMYAKSGSIITAQKLFEKNPIHDRDQTTWNAMIAGYMQNGQIEKAISVLRQMLKQKQQPKSVTIASILPACNPTGGIGAGKQLHSFALRHSWDTNIFVGTALVDMYSKCGVIDYAERLFNRMPERNSVTYTAMISGYGQHGLGERALSLFCAMPAARMKPDAVTFIAVLSACSYAGLVDEGLKIFVSMERDYGIHAMPEHYCCVVDMLGRAGRVAEAYEFVRGLGDEGDLVGIWGSLLGACRIHGEFELGKLAADRLMMMEKGKNIAGYHVLLSNIYAEEGEWESVDSVRKGMREKGLKKEAGLSWIEVGGVTHYFLSRNQCHPQHDNIYEMLGMLAVEMMEVGYSLSWGSEMAGVFDHE